MRENVGGWNGDHIGLELAQHHKSHQLAENGHWGGLQYVNVDMWNHKINTNKIISRI